MLHHISKSTTIYESWNQKENIREQFFDWEKRRRKFADKNIPSNRRFGVHVPMDGEIHMLACLLKEDVRSHCLVTRLRKRKKDLIKDNEITDVWT